MKFSFSKAVLCVGAMLWLATVQGQNNDCINAEIICSDDNIGTNPLGPGLNDFADPDNFDGCLSGENQSGWYYFEIQPDAPPGLELGFIINPDAGAGQDYDFAVFGPDVPCDDLGSPIRCSYAGGGCALCPQTGLGMGATDNSESPAGNGFVATLTVNPGEGYYLLIDNFSNNSTGFSMTWTGSAAPFLNCIECDADAGTVTANTSPACPSDVINYEVTGYFDDPDYTQVILITDENGDIVDIVNGDSGTLMSLTCATFTIYSYNYETAGGSFIPSLGDNISAIDCDVNCCDLSELEVTFEDTELPTFPNAPGDLSLTCPDDIPPLTDQEWQDNCDGANLVAGSEAGLADPCDGGTITRVWEYTDLCGNTGFHEQTITVEPTEEAMFINPPADLTVSCDAVPTGPAPDLAYTNNASGSCDIMGTAPAVRAGTSDVCGGTITYTWEATDPCGRTINHVQTITVEPAPEASFISPPGDITVSCSDVPSLTAPDLNYTNNEAGTCEIAGTAAPVQGGSADECGGTITFTWTFTDPCGRPTTHVQNITVEPAPEAAFLSLPADFSVSCADFDGVVVPDLDYTNNESGSCEISGTVAPQQSGFITECGGTITYTWEFTDNCGRPISHTQTLTVTPGPEAVFLDPPGDITVTCDNVPQDADLELIVDNGFTGDCEIFGQVQPVVTGFAGVCGGTLTYTWSFTDDCGRSQTHVQNITVEPGPTPAFVDPPANMTVSCGDIPTGPGPELTYDNGVVGPCEQFGLVAPTRFGSADECGGTITYQWSFTEACGEVITHQQIITVEPAPDPVFINLPTDGSISCGGDFNNPPELEYSNGATGDCAIAGTIVAMVTQVSSTEQRYDWSFTAPCSGNEITYSQTVTQDEAPDISLQPGQTTICAGESFDLTSISVTDANGTDPVITYHGASPAGGDNELPGTTVMPGDTTTYFILATNAAGCTDEQPFQLRVDPVPNAGNGSAGTICFELADSVNLFSFISGTVDSSGQWADPDGSGVVLTNPVGVNLTGAAPGTYNFLYIVGNPGVCPDDTATVTLELLPQIDILIQDLVCSADLSTYEIQLTATGFSITSSGGGTLTDLGGGQFSISGIPIANTVTITASNPIATGCERQFTVTPPDCNCPNVDPPASDGPRATCAGSPNPELSVTVGADQTANWYTTPTGGTAFLSGSTTFTPAETAPGRYEYYVETENVTDGCTSSLRTLVTLDINDNPTGMDAELIVCDVDDDGLAPFTLTDADQLINNTPGLSFAYFASLPAAQAGMPALPDTFVNTTPVSQDIFAQITNGDGCTAIVTVTLTVNLPPVFTLDITDESCPGAADGMVVVGADAGAMFSLDSSNWTTDNTFPDFGPGDYTMYVESAVGCFSAQDFSIAPGQELLVDVFDVSCSPNGTPSDETDDLYTISFTLNNSRGNAGTYTVNDGSSDWGSFAYGTPVSQTVPANGQSFTLTFTDDALNCSITRPVGPLESCSADCLISIDQLGFVCSDNNTPTNPGDDFYTVTISASAFNGSVSGTYTVLVDGAATEVFNYGEVVTFMLPASGGSPTIAVADSDDPLCTVSQPIGPLDPCSPDCDLGLSITNWICDDAGTGTDPSDDTFTFDVVVTGVNVSDQWTWIEDGFVGTYGDTFNFGPYPISGGDIPVTVADLQNGTCPISLTAPAPPPCSDECEITITTLEVLCIDNGTVSVQTDDFYTITVDAAVLNGGGTGNFILVVDGNPVGTFPYGTGGNITLPADGASPVIEVRDEGEATCTDSQVIGPLVPCTGPCMLEANVSDIVCDNQGTNDPTDDTFSFTLAVDGDNTSTGWRVLGDPAVNDYITPVVLGPFPIAAGDVLLEVHDAENTECLVQVSVSAPPSCSPTCSISSVVSNVVCDNQGTNDPSDDTFSFTAVITGENTGPGWVATDGTTGTYGTAFTFGPYLITDGDQVIDVEDIDNSGCITTLSVTAPPSCSPTCGISSVVSNIVCNDEGTNDPSDDTFTFTATITGENTGPGWTATDGTMGTYDEPITFGPYPIAGGDQTIDVEDVDNQGCLTQLFAPAPATCSPTCAINITSLNVVCNDNGTLSIQSDDFYEVTVNAAATDGGNTDNFVVFVDDAQVGVFAYEQGGTIILAADGSTPTITVRDETETECTDAQTIGPLAPCTDACTIQAMVTNVRCDDQGTGNDSSDDTFTFELQVTGQNTSGQWQSSDGTLSGVFGETITAGPYLITEGNLNLLVTDLENPNCQVPFMVMAPQACSFCRQTITTSSGATLTCAEPQAPLEATSSAPGSYEWTLDGTIISTQLNTVATVPGTYFFTATYPDGCVATDSVVIESTTDIPEITQIEIVPEQCAGDNNGRIIIEEITGGQSPYDYSLNGENVNTAGFFTRLPPGDYNIVITDANGCQTDTLITIDPGPDLKITEPLFLEVTQGDSGMVSVTVSVPEDELEYIQWTPPDQLSCDTCLTTRYLAEQSQNYILEVIHENGCIVSTSLQILARRALEVYVPNVFSPNEDGVNDRITVFANDRVVMVESFQIFDRWGENLFEGSEFPPNEPEFGWDGNLNGQPMNPQVLIYTTTLLLDDGSRVVVKGDFVLMR